LGWGRDAGADGRGLLAFPGRLTGCVLDGRTGEGVGLAAPGRDGAAGGALEAGIGLEAFGEEGAADVGLGLGAGADGAGALCRFTGFCGAA